MHSKTALLNGVRPGYISNDKAVLYSDTGAVHAKTFYLQDVNEDGHVETQTMQTVDCRLQTVQTVQTVLTMQTVQTECYFFKLYLNFSC